MKNQELAEKLIVGARIKAGPKYAEYMGWNNAGDILELVEGHFEYDNGLYTEDQTAPAVWDGKDWDSIYHLFGNDLENFMDCEILPLVV